MRLLMFCAIGLMLLAGCGNQADNATLEEETVALTSGIDQTAMDMSVRPQDDFFEFVNGAWLKTAEIPADRTRTGVFVDLSENARKDVLTIIQDLAAMSDMTTNPDEQKVAGLYNAFMDSTKLEDLGMAPLNDALARIDAISNRSELSAYFAEGRIDGGGGPFALYIGIDDKDATRYTPGIWQSGLGLPDRDYYFKEDERSSELRSKYIDHITTMFTLAGFENPRTSASAIMELETALADHHWTNVENRDSDKTYNLMRYEELASLGEGLDWPAYLAAAGLDKQESININQPTYIEGFNRVYTETTLEKWKIWLRWKLLNNYAGFLGSEIDQQNFEFYAKTLNGQQEQRPRWKRGVDTVNGSLGEVIGRIYVGHHFSPEAKARMVELVENLRNAYGAAIDELEWMSPETKAQAQVKLAAFTPKIGYPDIWEDYTKLEIREGDLVGNVQRAYRFNYEKDRAKLGGPIQKHEWGMNPQTVNAYYSPSRNEVVFPAAILQPPFFNMAADDAVNYGAIGAVIGHEMGHGFDDQGSKYDANGNLQNWWTDSDREEFAKRAEKLVAQADTFQVFDDLYLNGELTLGENIGDLSGLTIAHRAYMISLEGKDAPVIDGFTGSQRFFMGFAQVWRAKSTEDAMRNQVATDPHSPPRYRVLGPMANMPEFHAAFNVQPGDGMYMDPADRTKIW